MLYSEPFDKLIFQHEMLRAKLEVRNHYLKTVVDDIYENTGQLLSLIRVQLSIISDKINRPTAYNIDDTGKLVAEVICNLRDMSKSLYPETALLSETGLVDAIKKEIGYGRPDTTGAVIKVKGVPCNLPSEQGVIFFHVLLEIITLIQQQKQTILSATITYTKTNVRVSFSWSGRKLNIDVKHIPPRHTWHINNLLSVAQRIRLINGKIQVKNNAGQHTIGISVARTDVLN